MYSFFQISIFFFISFISCHAQTHTTQEVNIRWLINLLAPMLPQYHALRCLRVGMCGGLYLQNICGGLLNPLYKDNEIKEILTPTWEELVYPPDALRVTWDFRDEVEHSMRARAHTHTHTHTHTHAHAHAHVHARMHACSE